NLIFIHSDLVAVLYEEFVQYPTGPRPAPAYVQGGPCQPAADPRPEVPVSRAGEPAGDSVLVPDFAWTVSAPDHSWLKADADSSSADSPVTAPDKSGVRCCLTDQHHAPHGSCLADNRPPPQPVDS